MVMLLSTWYPFFSLGSFFPWGSFFSLGSWFPWVTPVAFFSWNTICTFISRFARKTYFYMFNSQLLKRLKNVIYFTEVLSCY